MLLSAFRLFWQLFVLFACCAALGRSFRLLVPKEFSLLNKVLFSAVGGLFLVVLIPQNLVYLGVPVRISAWLILGAALVQASWCFHHLGAWTRTLCANGEIRNLTVVILLTVTFHGMVPVRQGLEWYYGKGHFDQNNYVLLAEFLKEKPYGTSEQDIGLHPWLIRPIGFKKERIGQSIITAEISVWSGTDGQGGYAATVIFFLTMLAICMYVLLRETGIDCFIASSGALLAALLPAITRLSLNGFLSQVSILFAFPFFASLLRQDLSARSFTLFFSLLLAYVVAAYSEIAPIALGTLFLAVLLVREDKFRSKRLMLLSAILLIALANPYYLGSLSEFLGRQYYMAAHAAFMDNLAPEVLSLHAWSELIFGATHRAWVALIFDGCTILVSLLFLTGAILLSGRDRLVFGVILFPSLLVILYLETRTPYPSYPIAKIVLTILPLMIGLVFVSLSRLAAKLDRPMGVLRKVLCALIVAAAAGGSGRYYFEVLDDEGSLSYVREPHFLNVCHELEEIKNKRVLVFETNPLLTAWLCYHARHNDVYFDDQFISVSPVPPDLPFSRVLDQSSVDLVATRDRIVDLRTPDVSCLTSIDDTAGQDRSDGPFSHFPYLLGPPARLRLLALRSLSANLNMWFAPAHEATTFPIAFFLTDAQGHVFQGETQGKNLQVFRMSLPRGLSFLELSVQAKDSHPNTGKSFPIVAELNGIELSNIILNPAG